MSQSGSLQRPARDLSLSSVRPEPNGSGRVSIKQKGPIVVALKVYLLNRLWLILEAMFRTTKDAPELVLYRRQRRKENQVNENTVVCILGVALVFVAVGYFVFDRWMEAKERNRP